MSWGSARVEKVTGGEPLARKGVPWLIRGIERVVSHGQVTLTTNGVPLKEQIGGLVGGWTGRC